MRALALSLLLVVGCDDGNPQPVADAGADGPRCSCKPCNVDPDGTVWCTTPLTLAPSAQRSPLQSAARSPATQESLRPRSGPPSADTPLPR